MDIGNNAEGFEFQNARTIQKTKDLSGKHLTLHTL
jgi:hypothetical protein